MSSFAAHFFYKKNIENQPLKLLVKELEVLLAKVRMGLLLFITCFPLYIFVSAKTEWTISAGLPIFFNCQLMVRFPNPVSRNCVTSRKYDFLKARVTHLWSSTARSLARRWMTTHGLGRSPVQRDSLW